MVINDEVPVGVPPNLLSFGGGGGTWRSYKNEKANIRMKLH